MPKYTDFELDLQVQNAKFYAENPTKATILNPGGGDGDDGGDKPLPTNNSCYPCPTYSCNKYKACLFPG